MAGTRSCRAASPVIQRMSRLATAMLLTILLVAFTLVFLFATVTLLPYSLFSVEAAKAGQPVTVTVLVALLGS